MAADFRGIPSIEELNREYQARLGAAARATYTNEQLVEEWLRVVEQECTRDGYEGWKRCVKHLLAYCAEFNVHLLSLDKTEAHRYVAWVETADYPGRKKKGKLRATTVFLHIFQGSSLYNYLRDVRGLVLTNPFFPLIRVFKRRRRSELRPDHRALNEPEIPLLLEGCEDLDDFLFVLLPFKTGIRREEILGIRMEQINWKDRTIQLDPHPRRTYLKAYYDAELEFFLRLKVERNKRDRPDNPHLFPSPRGKGHICERTHGTKFQAIVKRSPLAVTITSKETSITTHTGRRTFTSLLKRRRPTAPQGCPGHIVAILRGDSLEGRTENTPETTQGIYTKLGQIDGVPEVRWWFDRCMPTFGAREIWERLIPTRATAASVAGLMRAVRARG
jgi:integrase